MGSVLQRARLFDLSGVGDLDGVALGHEPVVQPGPVERSLDGDGDGSIELG
jgi:hypothetical protein